jgi:hypothetical protein
MKDEAVGRKQLQRSKEKKASGNWPTYMEYLPKARKPQGGENNSHY